VTVLEIAVLIDLPETQPYFVATLAALEPAARREFDPTVR
jgi:hypothetical protein